MTVLSDISVQSLIHQLLTTLEATPMRGEAIRLRQEFESRAWQGLDQADVNQLLRLLAGGQAAAPKSLEPTGEAAAVSPPVVRAPTLAPSPQWSPLEAYASWVDSVPRGRELLTLLESLTRCDRGDEAAQLLHQLFVNHLRFEAHAVEETGRLDSNQILRRLRTVARHEAFVVSLLELSFPYEYPSTFQPVFRLHPYGLLVAIAPGWNTCQFVYRVKNRDAGVTTRTRSLVGRLWGESFHDTLIVWLRRLELLRPRGADSPAALLDRVEAALNPSPADLVGRWSSVPLLDVSAPLPGPSWGELPAHERRAFLQDDITPGTPRSFWGLERVLRSSFPVGVGDRRARVCYRDYTLGEESCSPQEAARTGKSWVRRVSLEVEVRVEDGSSYPVVLQVAVPEVSREGHMLLDGTWFRFVPRVSAAGRLLGDAVAPAVFDAEEDESSEEEVLEIEGAEPAELETAAEIEGASGATEPGPSAEEAEVPEKSFAAPDRSLPQVEGASLAAVLEMAAGRKLAIVRKRLMAWVGDPSTLATVLPSMLRGLAGRDPEMLLLGRQFLKLALEPVRRTGKPEDHLPVLRHVNAGAEHAPAWACPDVSAKLSPGTWLPVASARLSPAGDLAVPITRESGTVRLVVEGRPLWSVNSRTGAPGIGPLSWWIASELASFASLPAGRLESAAAVAIGALVVPSGLRALRVPGSQLRGWMRQGCTLGAPSREPRILQARIPAILREDGRPQHHLLCAAGLSVHPGQVWLEAPPALWGAKTAPAVPTPKGSPLWNFLAYVFHPSPSGNDAKKAPDAEALAREALAGRIAVRRKAPSSLAWHRWTIPPGLKGTVLEVIEREERDRQGICLGWRVTLVIAPDVAEFPRGHVVLGDGRVVPLEEGLSKVDVPFGDDGTEVDLLIEDPLLDGSAQGTSVWRSGQTGEVLPVAVALTEPIYLLASSQPLIRGPDSQLRFRARDGAGIPASAEAPAFSSMDWSWWSAVDPAGAVAVARVSREWSGGLPPFWPHLVEVLEAADVLPPTLPGNANPGLRAAAFATKPPPSATQVRRTAATYRDEKEAPFLWSCACGRLTGVRRMFEVCASLVVVGAAPKERAMPDSGCGTPVLLRAALSSRRKLQRLPLTEPVLHPWRMEAAAALIGLTRTELLEEQAGSGAHRLALRFAVALREADRTVLARARLATVAPSERAGLLRGMELLREMQAAGTLRTHRFLLSHLSMLPRVLQPTGLPPGAPSTVQSALTRAYQSVHSASRLLSAVRDSRVPLLVRTARRTLQEKVCVLFGSPLQGVVRDEPRSLAELTARLWPLTRAPRLRSVVPGTFRVNGIMPKEDEPAAEVRLALGFEPNLQARAEELATIHTQRDESPADLPTEEEVETAEGEEQDSAQLMVALGPTSSNTSTRVLRIRAGPPDTSSTGVLTENGPRLPPGHPVDALQPNLKAFWMRRAAKERLIRLHLPRLMMLFGACTPEDREEVQHTPLCRGHRGALLLRALLHALSTSRSNPNALCALLEASRPLPLESNGQRALERVSPALLAAFPGQGALCAEGRSYLAEVLVGWWTRSHLAAETVGWEWLPVHEQGPSGARRMLPPFPSSAWDTWPEMTAATAPVRFLLAQEGKPAMSSWNYSLQVVLGLDVEPLAETAHEVASQLPLFPDDEDTLRTEAVSLPASVEQNENEEVLQPSQLAWPVALVSSGATEDVLLLEVSLATWFASGCVPPPQIERLHTDFRPALSSSEVAPPASDVTLLDQPFLSWLRGGLTDV